jgi:predicted Zn-dependent protease
MRNFAFKPGRKKFSGLLILAALALSPVLLFAVEGLNFRPGFNLFSPSQDVEVGQQAATEVNKQLPLVRDSQVVGYVSNLGKRLAAIAPNQSGSAKYSWTFNVVNSSEINAFALPGGFIYVNRGAIEAAQDEAQIAGVIAHEEGHVVMRHGTHQASEMLLAQAPLSILAGLLGQSSSLAGQLAQLGLSFGVNSILLRNSRSAESQADEVGTYILYRAGYDPYGMAQFFKIIQQKYPQRTIQFFSDHPDPGNRIKNVDEEIPRLGPKKDWKTDSPEFEALKQRLQSMPPAPKVAPPK